MGVENRHAAASLPCCMTNLWPFSAAHYTTHLHELVQKKAASQGAAPQCRPAPTITQDTHQRIITTVTVHSHHHPRCPNGLTCVSETCFRPRIFKPLLLPRPHFRSGRLILHCEAHDESYHSQYLAIKSVMHAGCGGNSSVIKHNTCASHGYTPLYGAAATDPHAILDCCLRHAQGCKGQFVLQPEQCSTHRLLGQQRA